MSATTVQPPLFGVQQAERTSDDYYTPAWVFERMGVEFDLDVCAPPGGIPWIPAKRYFTQEDDGLSQPWEGLVWMNPPYSEPGPWVARFLAHSNGVCLIPASNGRWFFDLWQSADAMVVPCDVAIKWHTGTSVPTRVLLAGIGQAAAIALANFGGRVRL